MTVGRGCALGGLVVLSTLLSGCSSFADETPLSILDAAEQDMGQVTSMRILSEEFDSGVKETRDLRVTADGDCVGTVTQNGASVKVIRIDDMTFIRPDESYWPLIVGPSGGPLVSSLDDKWIVLDDTTFLDGPCDITQPYTFFVGDKRALDLENLGRDVIEGTDVVRLRGEDETGAVLEVAVTIDEPHLVLEMNLSGLDRGHAELSLFGDGIDVSTPAEGDTVHVQT